jgi:hypothetical protein
MRLPICLALLLLVQGAAFAQGAPPTPRTLPPPPDPQTTPPPAPPRTEMVDQVYKVTVGGEQVEVHLKGLFAARPTKLQPDDGSGGFFDRLAPAARDGNEDAVHALYRALQDCKPFPKSRAEFDKEIEQGRKRWAETGGVPMQGATPQSKEELDKWAQHEEKLFHRCDGVTPAMYERSKQLLRESVERGSDLNRFYYARSIMDTDPQGAREQFAILWEKGDIGGLNGLGTVSLPHRIASTIVASLIFQIPQEKVDEYLRKIEVTVSPNTFREANTQAAQLLKSPNCCRDLGYNY